MKNYSSVRLEITSHCNLNCDYCHNMEFGGRRDDMTTEEILRLIKELKAKYNIKKILLTGGEPLVNDDVFNIIKYITKLGIKADMVTNGTLLTKEVIKYLEESGLSRIRLSIDEVGSKSNLRGFSIPDKLWEIASMITQTSKIEVCIHTVCSPNNVKQLFDVYKNVLKSGAKRWRIFDLGFQGGITINKEAFKLDSYYDGIIDSTKDIIIHYLNNNLQSILDIEINNIFRTNILEIPYNGQIDIEKAILERIQKSPCDYVSDHQITIRSNGKATLCQYFHNVIFDFQKYDFNVDEAILNENLLIYENNLLMQELKDCVNCKYLLVCNSGCRSRAKFITDDITDADPIACYLFPKIQKEIVPLLPEETQKLYNSFINYKGCNPKYLKDHLTRFMHMRGF